MLRATPSFQTEVLLIKDPFAFPARLVACWFLSMFSVVRLIDLVAVASILWVVHTYIRYRRIVQRLNYLNGPHTLLSKPSLTTFLLPEIPFINTKDIWPWNYKWSGKHRLVSHYFSL